LPARRERLEPLISEERIRQRVGELAREIDADYRDKVIALVIVQKGAVVFAADLMRQISIPLTIEFIGASSYGEGTVSSGRVRLRNTDGLDIADRHVILVEDILETGLTSRAVIETLNRLQPTSLVLCTLLRKRRPDNRDLPARYIGFDIPEEFVVGYGMDYAERYRNLTGIFRLKFDAA
jgi:hypoxanthine phosphoribosyltransferase